MSLNFSPRDHYHSFVFTRSIQKSSHNTPPKSFLRTPFPSPPWHSYAFLKFQRTSSFCHKTRLTVKSCFLILSYFNLPRVFSQFNSSNATSTTVLRQPASLFIASLIEQNSLLIISIVIFLPKQASGLRRRLDGVTTYCLVSISTLPTYIGGARMGLSLYGPRGTPQLQNRHG